MSIRRMLASAALGIAASMVAPLSASADPTYPPVVGGLTVSATSTTAGSAITLSGGGFAPKSNAVVTVTVQRVGVVRRFTVTADSSGAVTTRLKLAVVGTNTITVSGVDSNGVPVLLSATVLVSAPPASGGGLPNTGANIVSPLVLGGILVLGGAAAILTTRRRRRRGQASSAS
jgi:LPXTG-motif cell wall-anchored protein